MDSFYPLVLLTGNSFAKIYEKFPKYVQNSSSYIINITDYNPADTDQIIYENKCEIYIYLDFNEMTSTEIYPIISTKFSLIKKLNRFLNADIILNKIKNTIFLAFS